MEAGNEIQTDAKEFEFEFWAEQARHNEDGKMNMTPPEEPQEENLTPVNYQVDLASGQVIEDLSEETYSERDDLERFVHGVNTVNEAFINITGHPDQAECIVNESQITAPDGYAKVQFNVPDTQNCEDKEVTFASYLNTGELGWSGGENMVLHDHITREVERGEFYNWTVNLPEPQPTSP